MEREVLRYSSKAKKKRDKQIKTKKTHRNTNINKEKQIQNIEKRRNAKINKEQNKTKTRKQTKHINKRQTKPKKEEHRQTNKHK